MRGNMKELLPLHVQHAKLADPLAVAAVCVDCLTKFIRRIVNKLRDEVIKVIACTYLWKSQCLVYHWRWYSYGTDEDRRASDLP